MARGRAAAAVGYGSTLFTMPSGVACPRRPPCSPLAPPVSAAVTSKEEGAGGDHRRLRPCARALMLELQCNGTQFCTASRTLNTAVAYCDIFFKSWCLSILSPTGVLFAESVNAYIHMCDR